MNLFTNIFFGRIIQLLTRSVIYFLLFSVYSVYAQENQLVQLRDQFVRYQENALQEKIFVHTSKDSFFSGETMFFKIYAVDGMLHRPLSLNSVAYFELINNKNEPIAQLKVSMKNGIGIGSIVIPDSLTTNRYRIIAYSSWMRNFSEEYFFAKEISIINPLKKQTVVVEKNEAEPVFRFFPEGGNLVFGLKSKVAFQGTDSNGKGLHFKGFVINDLKDTVASFQSVKFGMGNFSFIPEKGRDYKTYVRIKDNTIINDLPTPYKEGYVMTLQSELDGKQLQINIQSNLTNATGKEVYLFIHNRGRVRNAMNALIDDRGQASFAVPVSDIEDGISHLTLFSKELAPVAERLYFKKPSKVLSIVVKQNKGSYNRREPVSIELSTSESANLSLSVFKIDEIQNYDSVNIVNYLLLTSDLKGRIENPAYYFSSYNHEGFEATDNLMLTHGWRRFNWQDVIQNSWPVLKFGPDNEGLTIRAIITNENNIPLPAKSVFLSVPSNGSQFYAANSASTGLLQFYTHDLYGKNELTFQRLGTDREKFNITLISPFSQTYPSQAMPSFQITRSHETLIRSYTIYNQAQKIFFTNPQALISIDSIPFFGKPDKTYLLSDYVQFPQVNDVLREYVPEVIVRRHEKKAYLFTLNKATQTFFESEPFVLLDGVPVFETERVISLPSNQIKKIDIMSSKFYSGLFTFNGILSFSTYKGEFSGPQLNPEAVVFDFDGLLKYQEFYSPIPADENNERLPDFRNLLSWMPNINTEANHKSVVSFSTSNLKGKYIGVINGLSANGQAGSTIFNVEVK